MARMIPPQCPPAGPEFDLSVQSLLAVERRAHIGGIGRRLQGGSGRGVCVGAIQLRGKDTARRLAFLDRFIP
jgi:hypothetical protein